MPRRNRIVTTETDFMPQQNPKISELNAQMNDMRITAIVDAVEMKKLKSKNESLEKEIEKLQKQNEQLQNANKYLEYRWSKLQKQNETITENHKMFLAENGFMVVEKIMDELNEETHKNIDLENKIIELEKQKSFQKDMVKCIILQNIRNCSDLVIEDEYKFMDLHDYFTKSENDKVEQIIKFIAEVVEEMDRDDWNEDDNFTHLKYYHTPAENTAGTINLHTICDDEMVWDTREEYDSD